MSLNDFEKIPKMEKPTIREWTTGKSIFITGGSGFLGKVLVEKLLRSCPEIKDVYLLMRPKKGLNQKERIKKITDLPLFDKLKKEVPNAIETKIKLINGDVSELNLGISPEDRKTLIEKVNIIFHGAASVRFDDPLKKALLLNTRGTRELCSLALEMENLEVFTHISTTYCQCDKIVIEEEIYDAPTDWKKAIEIAEKADPQMLDIFCLKFCGALPNTYTFSKALSEQVVKDMLGGIVPTIVVRPSIVISSLREPIPGWIDNFNGPVGMLIGSGKGVLRVCYVSEDLKCDFIAVDLCIRGMVIAAWVQATKTDPIERNEISVFNASQQDTYRHTMGMIVEKGRGIIDDCPLEDALWYPSGFMTQSYVIFWICFMLIHMTQAVLIDGILKVFGRKPLLVRLQRKVFQSIVALEPFLFRKWTFINTKSKELEEKILPADLKDWEYGVDNMDIDAFFRDAVRGGKMYLLKEPMDNLEQLKKRHARLWLIHNLVKYGSALWLFWYIFVKVNVIMKFCSWFVEYYNNLPA